MTLPPRGTVPSWRHCAFPILLSCIICTLGLAEPLQHQTRLGRSLSSLRGLLQASEDTPVTFTVFMEFGENIPGAPNTTSVLQQNYVAAVAAALGIPRESVLTDAQLRYFRRVVDGEQTPEIYLRYATVNTTAYFPSEEEAVDAYLTLRSTPDAWLDQAFPAEVFPTLEYAEIETVLLGEELETPPVVTLPPTFADRSLVITTVEMGFSPPSEASPGLDQNALREKASQVLQESAGVPAGDVEILSVKTVTSPVPDSPEPATYLSNATLVSAVVFDTADDAEAFAQTSAENLGSVYNATEFPSLISVSSTQSVFLSDHSSTLPTIPAPEDVDLEPGHCALRFIATQVFEQSLDNTLTPEEAEACVDEYVNELASRLGISPDDILLGDINVTTGEAIGVVDGQVVSRQVVRSVTSDIYVIFDYLATAEVWQDEIPQLGQEIKPDCNGVPYNVTVLGTQVIYRGVADEDPDFQCDVGVNMTFNVDLESSGESIGTVTLRLGAALPREMIAYGKALTVSELQRYPGYTGPLDVAGRLGVAGYPDASLRLYGVLSGVGESVTGGIHIHEGYTCETSGPHLFNAAGVDPWTTTYSSDQFGIADVNVIVQDITLMNVTGRAVVVHDADGVRVACGIIGFNSPGIPPAIPVLPILPDPEYTQAQPTGNVVLLVNETNITISGKVTGMSPGSVVFLAILEGQSCGNTSSALASPITGENPWTPGLGTLAGPANVDGEADVSVDATGFPMSSLLRRTLVLLDGETEEVASCGLIPGSAAVIPTELAINSLELDQAAGVDPASTYTVHANYTVTQYSEEDAQHWSEAMLSSPDLLQVFVQGPSSFPDDVTGAQVDASSYSCEFNQSPTPTPTPALTNPSTQAPTPDPTPQATAEPTAVPTVEPTSAPTAEPTAVPTVEPTSAPTAEPTGAPTGEPTSAPTAEPTVAPTVKPTPASTAEPTVFPTVEPTSAPTAIPTAEATPAPDITATPDPGGVPVPSISPFPTQPPFQTPAPPPEDICAPFGLNISTVMSILHDPSAGSIDEKALNILFSFNQEQAAYGSSLGVSSLKSYPGYGGSAITSESKDMAVSGYVADNSLRVVAILGGLAPGAGGFVRIHEGYTCDSAGDPLAGADIWSTATFTADELGAVQFNALVQSLPLSSVTGRALVVELAEGGRAACGIIGTDSAGLPPSVPVSPLQRVSTYQGDAQPSGNLLISFNGSSITIEGLIAGLEPDSLGSIELLEGSSCANLTEKLASPITGEDPWSDIPQFQADEAGIADISVAAEGFPMSSTMARTVVLLDSTGTAMACGETLPTAADPPAVYVTNADLDVASEISETEQVFELLANTTAVTSTEQQLELFEEFITGDTVRLNVFVSGRPNDPVTDSIASTLVQATGPCEPELPTPEATSTTTPTAAPTLTPEATSSPTPAGTVPQTPAPTLAQTSAPTPSTTSTPTSTPVSTDISSPPPVPTETPPVTPTPSSTALPTTSAPDIPTPESPPDSTTVPTPALTDIETSPTASPTTPSGAGTPMPTPSGTSEPPVPATPSGTPFPTSPYPPCSCPLDFTTTLRFAEEITSPDVEDINQQVIDVYDSYIDVLSTAFGLPVSSVLVTGASVLQGVNEEPSGEQIQVLAGVEFETTAVFSDCARAKETEEELKINSFWPRETLAESYPNLDTVQVRDVNVQEPDAGECPTSTPTPIPESSSDLPQPESGDTPSPDQPQSDFDGSPATPASPDSDSPGSADSCDDYIVVPWILKAVPFVEQYGVSSSEDLMWAQALENHWRYQTVPELRRIVGLEMGVPPDSPRIEYNPDTDDSYRMERIHGEEWDHCPEEGIKKFSHINCYFTSSSEAEAFRKWVRESEGENVAGPLLEYDPMLCGVKARTPKAIYEDEACLGAGEEGDPSHAVSEVYDSPHESDGNGSPHESDEEDFEMMSLDRTVQVGEGSTPKSSSGPELTTPTMTPAASGTPGATATATADSIGTMTPSAIVLPDLASTATPISTAASDTAVPVTPSATATEAPDSSAASTPSATATATPDSTATASAPSSTATAVPESTAAASPASSATPVPATTAVPSSTLTATPDSTSASIPAENPTGTPAAEFPSDIATPVPSTMAVVVGTGDALSEPAARIFDAPEGMSSPAALQSSITSEHMKNSEHRLLPNSASFVASNLADLARNCKTVYNVRWDLTLIPGYINEEEEEENTIPVLERKKWSSLADEHFYLVTNVLIRHLAQQQMLTGEQSASLEGNIKLSSVVSHTRGRISSSNCGSQVRKHVRYDFTFESQMAADVFRDWLKPNESRAIAEPLAQMDPAGVCAAKGEAGAVIAEKVCAAGTATSLVDNAIPPSTFAAFQLP